MFTHVPILTDDCTAEYNDIQTAKRNTSRKKAAEKAAAGEHGAPDGIATNGAHGDDAADSPPAAKKARRSSGVAVDKDAPGGVSGDETISEDNGDDDVEDEDVTEDDEIDPVSADEEQADEDPLDTQDPAPPDDEALDNGEDSD
jgi:hypothetical protein